MFNKFKYWLKWKIAADELHELWILKQRIKEVGVWCSPDKKAIAISKFLLDTHDYPNQCIGTYGSIDDFREYLKTLD
ncbi:hypothetical protein [Vibrio phage JSF13]|jgi:hypothetical protein|uniref:Uncharacterized protein ORF226 n=1 Tax=Vibrio phage ICP1 TaxID=979525 RepID=F1D1P9_9CAUD|nr:hypothetical protein ViPhICP1_gp227 [Vibrio phage ICP1]ADX88270.1 hypothetical protein TUST1-191_01120 [Vibrio phage ICP1_2006_D]ADX88497.1 hypothetical protein TUST1-182_01120 [Vibrio phage ICP1_2006_C]ADX88721.1 hypothetical protein TUST1-159_01105 [Vibrio phage ICP1_2006_B]ADX88947.1 hypothetical protein TUST1-17_01105 [Vibrio phage ICP1_2006_A]ADX89177.1 hypothetical protein TUST1-15_01125 [Vibrio phage ICP1_2005_A]ADX89407.1 hypothetical protein TUST1-2_01135 [Vibrio phage ICP1_2001_A